MSKKIHYPDLPRKLIKYANTRALEFHSYSAYHMRIIYTDFVCLDVWTTAKYYVKESNYCDMGGKQTIERAGETGVLDLENLEDFLDDIFYAPFRETTSSLPLET